MMGSTIRHRTASVNGEHARKNARGECARGLDDAAVAHRLLDTEGGEHARDYDEDEGVGHPAPWADTPPESEGIVDCGRDPGVDVRSDEAFWLEREGVGE